MIRVLHVIGSLNNGGSQAMVMSLYRNIDRKKIQFDFITDRKDENFYAEEIKKLGGRIFYMPPFEGKHILRYIFTWVSFFKKHPEYNIIHGHVRSTASIYLLIAKKFGIKTIVHSHNTSSGKGYTAMIKNIMQYPLRYITDYLFACSQEAGEWLFGSKAIKKANFFLVKNAIEVEKYRFHKSVRDSIRTKYMIEDRFVIGNVGRFHPQKNHYFLIQIFNEVLKRDSNAMLMLVGDGEEKNSIIQQVINLNILENILFIGVSSEVSQLMQAMDIFVFPSLYEGLGIVVIEAQATGLPCLVSNTVPQETKLTNKIHFLSIQETPQYWASKIVEYRDASSREVVEEIAKQGYDAKDTAKWIQNFYSEILELKK